MTRAAWLRRIAPSFAAALAVILDATLARAGSLAYETAVMAAERRRLPILFALCATLILALAGQLALRARPRWARMRLGLAVPLLLVSIYWLAFEGGCPLVCPRGGLWSAPVDLRFVVAAAGATAIALASLRIAWPRR